MERVGQSASVVRQGKGCALPYRASAGLRSFPYAFPARYWNARASRRVAVRALLERADGATLKERTRRAVLTLGASVGAAAGLAWAGHLLQLRITFTDSAAPAGIYRLITVPAARGALVAACLPAAIARTGLTRGYLQAGDCPGGVEPVAKVLGALPGDVVEVAPDGVAVNGVPFANSATAARDSAGRPLAHVAWGLRRVSTGEVWLFGFHNGRSWDARYFGPVPLTAVRGVLRPIVRW
jgi:conjugative transfer signal peptidase TraF